MELYERIRELRKNHLHMSQTDFGERLGVSLSVINNIENNRLARPDQKLSLLKLICKEFSVNEEWLMNGIEPMFVEPETFNLHDFAKEHNITKLETEIVKTYLELDPSVRKMLIEHFKSHMLDQLTTETENEPPQPMDKLMESIKSKKNENLNANRTVPKMSREEIHAELDRQLDTEKEAAENARGYGRGSSDTATG